ncbi:hypothetical protein TVNIR_2076 [Thioalkalivibrio nitratireducens DSM 14787]|uniref:Uncharacterized protein n=1 Tax=Thioalkalivibrio nitratireducens (strain DSM 14787 / UNIQEM 213 / ALEN2) TaxID=1255043 RepID=L0DZC0_THIND|nr:hypothetical protein [Thioalkalivibrio nitratireducens]AGA33736.1 hypothetical protein TVNIR_2076 [Thioalkalivibrio nitratireducens DSM 14787]
MKGILIPSGLALLLAAPIAFGDAPRERTHGPCFNVTIQGDRVNDARVRQECDMTFSRTVQAGQHNSVETIQRGRVNDNKVRQYQHDWAGSRHHRAGR